jgi:signal transduction histidine kinase
MDQNPPRPHDTRVFTLESPPLRWTDIVSLIEGLTRALERPDTIRVSIDTDISDPMAWIDGERIGAAFANLAANAVEAMPGGGTLAVGISGDERQVMITIKDTGTGITQENMDKLFTPFFTTKPVGEGLGLGLPTAYAAIKAHGGAIAVESNADPSRGPTGTIVRITLPRGEPVKPEPTRLIVHGDE